MGDSPELHEVVAKAVQEMTSALLGATIAYTESDWAASSRLPGWTRAHVASHLAENAKALNRVVEGLKVGELVPLYADATVAHDLLEEGAARSPLALQIALDTSAGRLAAAFASLEEAQLHTAVNLGGVSTYASIIPLARLHEVVMHHADLVDGFTISDLDPPIAMWCLRWHCQLMQSDPNPPNLYLVADEGFTAAIGDVTLAVELRGTARQLLARLRQDSAGVAS